MILERCDGDRGTARVEESFFHIQIIKLRSHSDTRTSQGEDRLRLEKQQSSLSYASYRYLYIPGKKPVVFH